MKGYEESGFLQKLNISRQTLEILTPDKVWIPESEFRNIWKIEYLLFSDIGLAYENNQNVIQTKDNI